ncbi:hypothetical protein [Winogradskyella sediminis]|uniref:Chain length determinant protein n=1 Tax=Winogradskyella sediminis TaxID=1382466 RepID=A0A1H1S4I3_9FLAO|nr:hypothetical protein [Winogradskyella sediminis]SDS42698.1 hypothetical protein SAMN04489797_1578 [Winogradskyella sediminis]
MSEKLPQQPDNEEVDLGQLFNAIGSLFQKLFAFIGRIFKEIFRALIYAVKPIVNNIKIVVIILGIACVAGFILERFNEPVYVSDMVVKPYFESKYELNNNVSYFNGLIGSGNNEKLSAIFEIDTSMAKKLISFEIKLGPETQNDLLKEYGEYMESIDTSLLADEINYDKFIENRSLYSGSVFSIIAKAKSSTIFQNLEKGFLKSFENNYSKKLRDRTDSIYRIQKENYLEELSRVERLQEVYLEIKKSEANKGQITLSSGSLLPLNQEKTSTKEFELFQEELKIRNNLKMIEEKRYENSDLYDILSRFDEVGSVEKKFSKKYTLVFPIVIFVLLITVFIVIKAFKFIKEYEE